MKYYYILCTIYYYIRNINNTKREGIIYKIYKKYIFHILYNKSKQNNKTCTYTYKYMLNVCIIIITVYCDSDTLQWIRI